MEPNPVNDPNPQPVNPTEEPIVPDSEADAGNVTSTETAANPSSLETNETPEEQIVASSFEDPVPISQPVTSPKAKKRRKALIITLILVILLALAGSAYAILNRKQVPSTNSTPNTATKQTTSNETAKTVATDPLMQRFTHPTTGETWYDTYKPLAAQGFSNPANGSEKDQEMYYFEVGKHGNNVIIARQTRMLGTETDLFEKAPDGTVTFIAQPNANATYDKEDLKQAQANLKSTVKFDQTTHYDSLSVPKKITLDNGEVVTYEKPYLGQPGPGNPDYQKPIASTTSAESEKSLNKYGGSELFEKRVAYTDTKLTALSYNLTLPIKTRISLVYHPVGSSFKDTTWNNGYNGQEQYLGIVRGCGSTSDSASIGTAVTDADFVAAGKTTDGITLYDFKDKNNAIVQKAYTETKEFYKDDTNFKYRNVTIDEFMRDHGVFAAKSKNGEWLILSSDRYAPVGGCAKPVVYLYPTVPTTVTVRVGADVKVSDPLYDAKKGWTVLAYPSGQLVMGGKTYGSLFWEGPGWGTYPGIISGTVVPRSQAAATMRNQLIEQGLNAQETQDFMDYWASRIPNKPFVRLTWFTTDEINRLAPLLVTPKANTVFRVFLDMDGFDQPISLQPQQLQKLPARNGFTVIEWGGLSHAKLY